MWMSSNIFLSCCLFPLRFCDLYLELLVAAPQTLITGNPKHVMEPEWIWKGRTCRLGSGNLRPVVSGEPYSMHASHELPGGGSTLSRADGLPLRWKGQRVYWAQILWVCDWLKRWSSFCRQADIHTTSFSKQERYGFQWSGPCTWGPSSWSGRGPLFHRWQSWCGPWAFCSGSLITWPGFSAWEKVWNVENSLSDNVQLVSKKEEFNFLLIGNVLGKN